MPDYSSIFPQSACFDPQADFELFLKQTPAKWVVYLLADEMQRPVQLLCVKNLRSSLKRRLGGDVMIGPSRRVNYRDLVRHIFWRRVDSAFEADWQYFEAARQVFPQSYRGMVGFRPAWFVHVDPDAQFPRYVRTIDLSTERGVNLGPVEDKHVASRLMQLAEDAFDLCRYYNVLVESPRAKPCAYKEMGRCPAPCDGSISIEQYRRLVEWSVQTIIDPQPMIAQQTQRMAHAAAELRFESAGRIKAYLDLLGQLGKGPFRHVRRLEDFRFVSMQRGPHAGTARAFLITPGAIEEFAGVIAEPAAANLPEQLRDAGRTAVGVRVDELGAERLSIVAQHLFLARQTSGVFLHLDACDEKSLGKAYRDLMKQKSKDDGDEEGLMKELQAM